MGKHLQRPVLDVVDLFAGLGATSTGGGWSHSARTRGHNVITSDLLERFGCTVSGDILEPATRLDIQEAIYHQFQGRRPHIVLASPPCDCFSVASIGAHWTGGRRAYIPKTEKAKTALRILQTTVDFIRDDLRPDFFIIENPTGVMRKMEAVAGLDLRKITMCQFGMPYMKPTDLFGVFPPNLALPPACKNGDPCHEWARRGARTGVQGISGPDAAAERALIPSMLSLRVTLALEHLVAKGMCDDACY